MSIPVLADTGMLRSDGQRESEIFGDILFIEKVEDL